MDYQKVSVQLQPDTQDFRDIVMATFGDLGFDSFVEETDHIQAFVPVTAWKPANLSEAMFQPLFKIRWEIEFIKEQNWNEVWEKNYFKPLLVANQCLIRAPFHTEFPTATYDIIIEPKMAFGTGNHETTSLVIEEILQLDVRGQTILDMGCGTGVLSILASMKGAKNIVAIDIDKWAYESTVENTEINRCSNIEARLGNVSLLGNETFDLIFANIHKNVLLNDMHRYVDVLNTGGKLFMSGFYTQDLDDLKEVATLNKLSFVYSKVKNNWVVGVFQKN